MRSIKRTALRPIQNSRGFLTAEFLFALVLSAGLSIVLFSLDFTLSMAEVAQYIAYSTSRAHAAGHIDQDKQEELARNKFKELVNNPVLKPLFNNPDVGWFSLSEPDIRGGGPSGRSFDDYPYQEDRVPQVGVRFDFKPQLLNMKIAFLGSTAEDPDAGFSAKITGFLIREPTHQECYDLQIKKRYEAILNLDQRYKILGQSGAGRYVPMEDNGC